MCKTEPSDSIEQKDTVFFEEKQISQEVIFDGKVLHVRKDRIRLPDGNIGIREYCLHNGAVAVVPLTKDNEVICVRQYRYALHRVTLEIPAGKLDGKQEDVYSAALRELREETGYIPGKMTAIGGLNTSPALLTEVIHMYLAEDLTLGDTEPDDDEFIEIVKIPLADMVDKIVRGEISDSKTQAAILKVWVMKQTDRL